MVRFNYRCIRSSALYIGILSCLIAGGFGCVQSGSIQDSGDEICMQHGETDDGDQQISPDEPIDVYIVICGHSNWESVETSCEAEVSGQEILISSQFDYKYRTGDAHAMCVDFVAKCELPPLSEGTYTIIHGESERELIVPSGTEPVLDCPMLQGRIP